MVVPHHFTADIFDLKPSSFKRWRLIPRVSVVSPHLTIALSMEWRQRWKHKTLLCLKNHQNIHIPKWDLYAFGLLHTLRVILPSGSFSSLGCGHDECNGLLLLWRLCYLKWVTTANYYLKWLKAANFYLKWVTAAIFFILNGHKLQIWSQISKICNFFISN